VVQSLTKRGSFDSAIESVDTNILTETSLRITWLKPNEFLDFIAQSIAEKTRRKSIPGCPASIQLGEDLSFIANDFDSSRQITSLIFSYLNNLDDKSEVAQILPYLRQIFLNQNTESKQSSAAYILDNITKYRRSTICYAAETLLMAAAGSQELFRLIDQFDSCHSFKCMDSRAREFLHYRKFNAIFEDNPLPAVRKRPTTLGNQKVVAQLRSWLKDNRILILEEGKPRSNKMTKIYLKIIDCARTYLMRGLKRFITTKERSDFLENFILKLKLELHYAIRIDVNDKASATFRPWTREQLISLDNSLEQLPFACILFTPRLHQIFIGTAKQSWNSAYDNMGIRHQNGGIALSRHTIASTKQKEMAHRGVSAFKATLLHEIAHALQFGDAREITTRSSFEPSLNNYNPQMDQKLFLELTGWKIINSGSFKLAENNQIAIIDNEKYPIGQPCLFRGDIIKFLLVKESINNNGHKSRERYLIYQVGERHFNDYGSTLPYEQYAVSFVDYCLQPLRLAETSPGVYLAIDQFLRLKTLGRERQKARHTAFENLKLREAHKTNGFHRCVEYSFGPKVKLIRETVAKLRLKIGEDLSCIYQVDHTKSIASILEVGRKLLGKFGISPHFSIHLVQYLEKLTEQGELTILSYNHAEFRSLVIQKELESLKIGDLRKLFSVSHLGPKIRILHSPSSEVLAFMMLRFQEYYESPNFHGKFFSLEEFKNWYNSSKATKDFSYYSDWSGFNFPGSVTDFFTKGLMGPLSEGEKSVLTGLFGLKSPYYVIGVAEEANGSIDMYYLRHELSHACYHLYPSYRQEVQQIIANLDLKDLKAHLLKIGYARKSLEDECVAYLNDGPAAFDNFGLKLNKKIESAMQRIQSALDAQLEILSSMSVLP
jgi:hypothetical protein